VTAGLRHDNGKVNYRGVRRLLEAAEGVPQANSRNHGDPGH
jgi:hypothetical protein